MNKATNKEQRLLLSIICTAYEAMPLSLLAELTDFDEYDAEDELLKMGSLIRHAQNSDGEVYISLFAKAFRDYLISGSVRKYSVDIKKGIKCISEFILANCPTEKELAKYPYLCRYGYTYLLLYYEKEPDRVQDYISDQITQNHDKAFNHLGDALCNCGETAVDAYFSMRKTIDKYGADIFDVLQHRREKSVLKQISYKYEQKGNEGNYYFLLAEIEMFEPSLQAYERADEMYRKCIELNKQDYHENPCHDSRRNLSVSYCSLADMLIKQRTEETLKEAEQLYKKSIELSEQNCQENSCYGSRITLSISYYKYSLLLLNNEQYSFAEEYLVKSAELFERLLKDFETSEIKTVLIYTYEYLIDIAQMQDTPEYEKKAEKWRKRLEELEK